MSYIAVEGAIGTGKTTLARLLADRVDAKLLLEAYEDNPFLDKFYADRKHFAFQAQLFFLLSRFRQQRALNQTDLFYENVISDYIFAKDRIFAALNLNEDELALYSEVERTLKKVIPVPDVVIFLQGSAERLMQGIQRRGRRFEEPITEEYLDTVVRAYNDFFFHYRTSRLIVIDTDKFDFYSNPDAVELVLKALYRRQPPPVEYLVAPEESPIFSTGTPTA